MLLYPFFGHLSHETAALPTQSRPRTLPISIFLRTSQAKSLVLASTSATCQVPLAHFFLTSHAIAQFLYKVSSPLFVALSTGSLVPSWGLLGTVLGHLGGRLGSILGHLGAVLLLFSIQRAAAQVVPSGPPIASIEVAHTCGSHGPVRSLFLCLHHERLRAGTVRIALPHKTCSALPAFGPLGAFLGPLGAI